MGVGLGVRPSAGASLVVYISQWLPQHQNHLSRHSVRQHCDGHLHLGHASG
jgi:hypothetical protein